jgi:hypothetical protein
MRLRTIIGTFLLSVFLCPAAALAQEVVSGTVTFSEDGVPAAGVRITFFDLGDLHRAFSGITDSDGRFEMPIESQDRSQQGPSRLLQNYPNPFNPSTVIPYQLHESAVVRLEVFNVLGQGVRTLVDGVQSEGRHTAHWDALDDQRRGVAAGVYLYSLTVGGVTDTRRMVLLDGRQTSAGGGFPRSAGVISNTFQQVGGTYGVTIYGPDVVISVQQPVVVDVGTGSLSFSVSRVGSQTAPKVTQEQADVLGDVNNDGRVNISDALIVATYGLDSSIAIPNNGDITLGDVNGDGRVNISDALMIASYGIDPSNPALPDGIGQPVQSSELVVTNLTHQPSDPNAGSPVTFSVQVSNTETEDATGVWIVLRVNGTGEDSIAVDIGANQEAMIEFDPLTFAGGAYTVEVVADPHGLLTNEANRDNNRVTQTVTVPFPTLSGRVTGAGDKVRQGATVYLKNHPDLRERTNAKGNYGFPLEGGFQDVDSLIVEAAGYERYAAVVFLSDADIVFNVRLTPSGAAFPVANVRAVPSGVSVGSHISLLGDQSSDPLGGFLVYHWSQMPSNPFPVSFGEVNDTRAAVDVRFILSVVGNYRFVLVVENQAGLISEPFTIQVRA